MKVIFDRTLVACKNCQHLDNCGANECPRSNSWRWEILFAEYQYIRSNCTYFSLESAKRGAARWLAAMADEIDELWDTGNAIKNGGDEILDNKPTDWESILAGLEALGKIEVVT